MSRALSVRAHLPAAFMPRAPAMHWVLELFEAGVHSCESLRNTMPLSNECLSVGTHTLTMRTAHRARRALAQKTVLVWQCTSMSVMLRRAHRCRAERLAGAGPRRPPGRRVPSRAPRARPRPARRRRLTDSFIPTKRSGERLLTPGGYLFLRPPGGRAPTGRVRGGTP